MAGLSTHIYSSLMALSCDGRQCLYLYQLAHADFDMHLIAGFNEALSLRQDASLVNRELMPPDPVAEQDIAYFVEDSVLDWHEYWMNEKTPQATILPPAQSFPNRFWQSL